MNSLNILCETKKKRSTALTTATTTTSHHQQQGSFIQTYTHSHTIRLERNVERQHKDQVPAHQEQSLCYSHQKLIKI